MSALPFPLAASAEATTVTPTVPEGMPARIDRQFDRALGSVLIDTDGRRYIDFHCGGGVFQYGHNDPELCEALVRHVRARGLCAPASGWTEARARFLDHFAQDILRPRQLSHTITWAGASGREALAEALRLARAITGRERVLVFSHGRTAPGAEASVSYVTPEARRFAARAGVTQLPYDTLGATGDEAVAQIEALLSERAFGLEPPAAVLVETVQADGALDVARPSWLKRVAQVVRRHGALLIADESLAGCGRTGAFFSFEDLGLRPDLVVLSTPASGFGLPMGLVLLDSVLQAGQGEPSAPLLQGGDHAFVTGAAALAKFWRDDHLSRAVARRARWIRSMLQIIAAEDLAETVPQAKVKGRGLAIGLDLRSPELAERIVQLAAINGLVIGTCVGNAGVLRLMPALNVPDLLLEQGLDLLRHAVGEGVRQHRKAGRRLPIVAADAPTLTMVVSPPTPGSAQGPALRPAAQADSTWPAARDEPDAPAA